MLRGVLDEWTVFWRSDEAHICENLKYLCRIILLKVCTKMEQVLARDTNTIYSTCKPLLTSLVANLAIGLAHRLRGIGRCFSNLICRHLFGIESLAGRHLLGFVLKTAVFSLGAIRYEHRLSFTSILLLMPCAVG